MDSCLFPAKHGAAIGSMALHSRMFSVTLLPNEWCQLDLGESSRWLLYGQDCVLIQWQSRCTGFWSKVQEMRDASCFHPRRCISCVKCTIVTIN